MRTNIVIDDQLMRETLQATGLKTKREAVEEGPAGATATEPAVENSPFSREVEVDGQPGCDED